MRWPTQWIRGNRQRKRTILTVCWTDGRVSLVRWGGPAERGVVERTTNLEPAACTAAGYLAARTFLLGALEDRAWVEWVVLLECFPAAGREASLKSAGNPGRRAPDWMEACWRDLPVAALPDRILSGMDCLEAGLRGWTEFNQPGTGVCFSLDGHELFLGYGESTYFRRLSRRGSALGSPEGGPNAEWLQQTRMLHRGRTGQELRRVLCPELVNPDTGAADDVSVELVPNRFPPAWIHQAEVGLPAGLLYLHACGWRMRDRSVEDLQFAALEERIGARRQVQALRLGTLLLLGGWGLLLLGACESDANRPNPVAGRKRWEQETQRWEGLDRLWRMREERRTQRERPYCMVGAIGESIPEHVRLERIRIEEVGPSPTGKLSLLLEGVYEGPHASPVFRGWMETLKSQSTLSQVESLRFEETDQGIAFHLVGTTGALEDES